MSRTYSTLNARENIGAALLGTALSLITLGVIVATFAGIEPASVDTSMVEAPAASHVVDPDA